MLGYVTFGANDMAVSGPFYAAVLGTIGYKKAHDGEWHGYCPDGDMSKGNMVWLGAPYNGQAAVPSNGTMIGFMAPTRQMVRDFHATALKMGGTSEGEPGIREAYGPNMYMAYVRDPIGNKMSVMCMADSE